MQIDTSEDFRILNALDNEACLRLQKLNDYQIHRLDKQLQRGQAILTEERQCQRYLQKFGIKHFTKLRDAYLKIDDIIQNISQFPVTIIDYGCGIGLGTTTLIEHLHVRKRSMNITAIKMIDASRKALEYAYKSIEACKKSYDGFVTHPVAECLQVDLNELTEEHIKTHPDEVKLHIFSNILDMESIDIERLARVISESQYGLNIFVCVSPLFPSSQFLHERNIRTLVFEDCLRQNHVYERISCRWSRIYDRNEYITTRFERIFTINFNEKWSRRQ